MSEEINCKLSISQAILNTLVGEWHYNIRKFATIINENIEQISSIDDHNDRYNKIIELLNFEETDATKIIKQPNKVLKIVKQNQENKKNNENNDSQVDDEIKNSKKNGRKITECPVPFWCVFKSGTMISNTVNQNNCQALKNPLYNQCTNPKAKNSDYCIKCGKTIDENGLPKNGNIEMRIEQFKGKNYEFVTPSGIKKKIYFRDYCDKKNFTSTHLSEILKKNNINFDDNEIEKIMYKREKKATGRKPKKIEENKNIHKENDDNETNDSNNDNNNENDNDDDDEDNDEDDSKSINTDFTEQTENEEFENEYDISKYGTIKTSVERFGVLLEDKEKIMEIMKNIKNKTINCCDNTEQFELYEVDDYINETSFTITDFNTPIAYFKYGKISKIK